jgi:ABC-type Na+ efflux pump permease subunit
LGETPSSDGGVGILLVGLVHVAGWLLLGVDAFFPRPFVLTLSFFSSSDIGTILAYGLTFGGYSFTLALLIANRE